MSSWSSALSNRLVSQLNGDWLKVRIARSFIQRYLGEFLEEKLRLEQLNVQVIDGKAQISDVHLHVANVNQRLEEAGLNGIQLVSGFVHSIGVQVPWKNLLSQSTVIELDGVELTLRISRDLTSSQEAGISTSSLFVGESMLQSAIMSTSMDLAGEMVDEAQLNTEDRQDATQGITQLIVQFLTQVCVTVTNVRIRFEFAMNLTDKEHNLNAPMTESQSETIPATAQCTLDRQESTFSQESKQSNVSADALFTFELRIKRVDFFDEKANSAATRGVMLKDTDELGSIASLADDAKCIRKHLSLENIGLYFDANLRQRDSQRDCEARDCQVGTETGDGDGDQLGSSTMKSVRFDDTIHASSSAFAGDASLYYSVVSRIAPDASVSESLVRSTCPSRFVASTEDACDNDDDDNQPALDLEEALREEEENERQRRLDECSSLICIAKLFGRIDAPIVMCTMPDRTDQIATALHIDPLVVLVSPKRLCELLSFTDCLRLTAPPNTPAQSIVATRHLCVTARCVLCVFALLHDDDTISSGQALESIAESVRQETERGALLQADGRVDLLQLRRFLLNRLDDTACADQLRLVVKSLRAAFDSFDAPRGRDEPETLKVTLDLATCELTETLFSPTIRSSMLLRFSEDASQADSMALRLTYSTKADFTVSALGDRLAASLRVDAHRTAFADLDITMIDRLTALVDALHEQQSLAEQMLQTVAYARARRAGRHVAVPDAPQTSSASFSISELELRMRVPVPDRTDRSAKQHYVSRLRDESLVLRLRQLSIRSDTLFDFSAVDVFELSVFCNEAAVLLEMPRDGCGDGSVKSKQTGVKRVPIAFVCSRSRMDELEKQKPQTDVAQAQQSRPGTSSAKSGGIDLNMMMSMHSSMRVARVHFQDDSFRIVVRIRNAQPCGSLNDADADDADDTDELDMNDLMTSSMHPSLEARRPKRRRNTPFSKTRHYVQDRDRQLTTPATPAELQHFYEDNESNSRLQITIDFPFALVELPSKRVFETVYNRLANDFSLWEPRAPPAGIEAVPSTMTSIALATSDPMPGNSFGQPQVGKSNCMQKSSMMRSSMFRDFEPRSGQNTEANTDEERLRDTAGCTNQNKVTVNLAISRGHVLVHCSDDDENATNVRSPDRLSFYAKVHDLRVFSTSPFCPDVDASYTTLQLTDITLYERTSTGSICHLLDKDALPAGRFSTFADKHAFELVLDRCGDSMRPAPSVQLGGAGVLLTNESDADAQRDMLVCVLQTNDQTVINHRYLLVSLRVNWVCAHLRLPAPDADPASAPKRFALTELADFFNVRDEPIAGYDPPRTQSFVNLEANSIKLLHVPPADDPFPFGFTLDCEKLTLILKSCKMLATEPTSSVPDDVSVRLLLEQTSLMLSKLNPNAAAKHGRLQSNPIANAKSVRVLYSDFFDLTLNIATIADDDAENSTGTSSREPTCELELQVRSQRIAIETCADSCAALIQTIQYLASRLEAASFSAASDKSAGPDATHDKLPHESPSSKVSSVAKRRDSEEPTVAVSMNEEQKKMMASAIVELEGQSNMAESSSKSELVANQLAKELEFDVDFEKSYCFIEKPPSVPGKPEWRCLLEGDDALRNVRVVNDHLRLPDSSVKSGMRRRPYEHWFDKPAYFPVVRSHYRLELGKLTVQLFGGADFLSAGAVKRAAILPPATVVSQTSVSTQSARRAPGEMSAGHTASRSPMPVRPVENASIPHSYSTNSLPAAAAQSNVAPKTASVESNRFVKSRDGSESLLLSLLDVQFQHEEFHASLSGKVGADQMDMGAPYATSFIKRIKPLERNVFVVRSIELDDQLADSDVRKLLHPFYSDDMPQRTNAPVLCVKILHVDADADSDAESKQLNAGCRADDSYLLKISALPIRINLHQSTLLFCLDVAQQLTLLADVTSQVQGSLQPSTDHSASALPPNASESEAVSNEPDGRAGAYFKTVIFERDVLVVLDYVGGNQFDMQYGALAAIVGSLTQLRDCRIVLKRVVYERGLLGLRNVFKHLAVTWYQEMSAKKLVVAFEPVSFAMRLLRGIFDLFYEPFDQFRRNRSVLTGVKRGCRSFTQSTGVAALELLCRLVQYLERLARVAHDIVSPQAGSRAIQYRSADLARRNAPLGYAARLNENLTNDEDIPRYDEAFRRSEGADAELLTGAPAGSTRTREMRPIRATPQQPADVRDGIAQASSRVCEGTMHVAHNIIDQALAQSTLPNAVGAIVTNVPAAVTQQAANTADGLQLLVQGIANHIDPNRKEREEKKWKTPV